MHSFKICVDGAGRGYVEMDGQRLKGVRAVSISAAVDETTAVSLEFISADVDVEASLVPPRRLSIVGESGPEVARLEAAIKELVRPGEVERRAIAAVAEAKKRRPPE
jgi:hypothetical protein